MSVINQMLRDLQARGEPLTTPGLQTTPGLPSGTRSGAASASSAAGATPTQPPLITPFIVPAAAARTGSRTRAVVWSLVACLLAGVAIGWYWQDQQVRDARKVRTPLGYAEFGGAIDPRPDAPLLPAVVQVSPATPAALSAEAAPAAPATPAVVAASAPAPAAAHSLTPVAKPVTAAPAPKLAPPPSPALNADLVLRPSAVQSQSPEQQIGRAADLITRGRHAEAAALLQQALAAQPQHVDARRALAALQYESGAPEAALVTLLDGAALNPARFAPLAATLQAERGDAQGAQATLARIPAGEQTPQHQALAAGIAQRLGQHDTAVATYRRALAAQPKEASWWIGLGISLDALGDERQAQNAYGEALALPALSDELRQFALQRRAATRAPY